MNHDVPISSKQRVASTPTELQPHATIQSRPLSDIREITESSIVVENATVGCMDKPSQKPDIEPRLNSACIDKKAEAQNQPLLEPILPQTACFTHLERRSPASSNYSQTPEPVGQHDGAPYGIPVRSSSRTRTNSLTSTDARLPISVTQRTNPRLQVDIKSKQTSPTPILKGTKQEAENRLSIADEWPKLSPHDSRWRSMELLDNPHIKHPRVQLLLQLAAPLAVAGGVLEGFVTIVVDGRRRKKANKQLGIAKMTLDLIGCEISQHDKRNTFLAFNAELIDRSHSPPASMLQASMSAVDGMCFWSLTPSTTAIPFSVGLPLETGPPPFSSKYANIFYTLSVTALLCEAAKRHRARVTQVVELLPTFDPESVLACSPAPLGANDTIWLPFENKPEYVTLSAELHREVWVSGGSVFLEIGVTNETSKPIKKVCINLEQDILLYRQSTASAEGQELVYPTIFEERHRTTIASTRLGRDQASGAFPAYSSHTKVCALEVPRGHVTIPRGRYFEVAYSILISAILSGSRQVTVKLPLFLIHLNSLDVIPNSITRVANAFNHEQIRDASKDNQECTYTRGRPLRQGFGAQDASRRARSLNNTKADTDKVKLPQRYGRSFSAPRQQSLEREAKHRTQLEKVRHLLDISPRKYGGRLRPLASRSRSRDVTYSTITNRNQLRNEILESFDSGNFSKTRPAETSFKKGSSPVGEADVAFAAPFDINRQVKIANKVRSTSEDNTKFKSRFGVGRMKAQREIQERGRVQGRSDHSDSQTRRIPTSRPPDPPKHREPVQRDPMGIFYNAQGDRKVQDNNLIPESVPKIFESAKRDKRISPQKRVGWI